MALRLKRNSGFLKKLCDSGPIERKQLVRGANADQLKCIGDFCLNILKGNLKATVVQKKRLARHKAKLRKVAYKPIKVADKKKILLQKGGILPALIPILTAALPIVAELISKAV